MTNGQVHAIATGSECTYIGGEFTWMCPYGGGGIPVSAASAQPEEGFAKVSGVVNAAAPDGGGGWYIGGAFSAVGGVARDNLAHILANGSLDTAWNPGVDGAICAMVVSGGCVYVGGVFGAAGGQARPGGAAFYTATGALLPWNPNADGTVCSLASAGGIIYAGGEFTQIGGQARSHIAALDTTTGTATAWNPGADAAVLSLAVSGGSLIAGGYFTTLGGTARNNIGAVDLGTGAATSWDPDANGLVSALAVDGSVIYAGGQFTSIGGETRSRIAGLDAASALATPFQADANSQVHALLVSGTTLYAGGSFITLNGQERHCVGAFDLVTGSLTSWNPSASSTVWALASAGSTVYIGGRLNGVGGCGRARLAALDASGVPLPWNPTANNQVYALSLSGDTVYAGGIFSAIGGQERNNIAALDGLTGAVAAWDPGADAEVYSLAAGAGVIYAGGAFSIIGGQERRGIAALDAAGAATAWDPSADGTVYALAVSGSDVYAGGSFIGIGGNIRLFIAELDVATGLATAWNPGADDCVQALAVEAGTLYAGGPFSVLGGESRMHLGAIDRTSGAVTTWDPGTDGYVYALAIGGGMVYAGGDFLQAGGAARNNVAALDAVTALPSAWAPNPNGAVRALGVASNSVLIGGMFTQIGSDRQEYIAQFDEAVAAPSNPGATAIGLNTITWTWVDPFADETGFSVYADAGAGPPATLRTTTAANAQMWQHNGLSPNTQYAFQVAAEGTPSGTERSTNYSRWTLVEPVSALTFSAIGQNSMSVMCSNALSNLAGGGSGVQFSNMTQGTDSGWLQNSGGWVSSGLSANTAYSFTGQSRNGEGITTVPASGTRYTLAATPLAPILSNAQADSLDVSIAEGDGNPGGTDYALQVSPAVSGLSWVQADGTLGAAAFYQARGAWAGTTITGLAEMTSYACHAVARNGDGVLTGYGPQAALSTVDDGLPSVAFELLSPLETGADVISFAVEFDEEVTPAFSATALGVHGLAGVATVSGAFPSYTVNVTLAEPDADGTLSISVAAGAFHDLESNACAGGMSACCTVCNWHGFTAEPAPVKAYEGDSPTFSVVPGCAATSISYAWKWEDGAKSVRSVGTDTAVMLVEGVTSAHEGTYWCEVSYDGHMYATAPASLEVTEHVRIEPLEDRTVADGESCTFNVNAAGGYPPYAYVWRRDDVPIEDATGASYTTPTLTGADDGSLYTVQVTDSNGDSETATVGVAIMSGLPGPGLAALVALVAILALAGVRVVLRDATRHSMT